MERKYPGVNNLIENLMDLKQLPSHVNVYRYKIKLRSIISKYFKISDKNKKLEEYYKLILQKYKNQHDLYNIDLKLQENTIVKQIIKIYRNPLENIIITKIGENGTDGDFQIIR
jgi:hypothetical protein